MILKESFDDDFETFIDKLDSGYDKYYEVIIKKLDREEIERFKSIDEAEQYFNTIKDEMYIDAELNDGVTITMNEIQLRKDIDELKFVMIDAQDN